MSDDTISLNEQRALRADNSMLWTAHDCAKAFLRDIEAGKINPDKLVILYTDKDTQSLEAWYAQAHGIDIIAMLWGKLWRVTQRQWP